jgi:3-hydroxyacyl-CoA dehydrogenase/enoyl-CoA hydratase/3-hydroxybutyryl-CoA epimerase
MYSTLGLNIDDGIALVTIDLPDKPMNVLTPEFQNDLASVIERVREDAHIQGAILTSGKRAFFAGADLKWLSAMAFGPKPPLEEFSVSIGSFSRILREMETCGKPFVSAINGLALGGGFELCLATHHIVLVDDPRAVVGQPEVTVGLLPGAGGTQRLPRRMGIAASLPLLLQGRPVPPKRALAIGMVDAVVAAGELIPTARQWILAGGSAVQPWDQEGFCLPGGTGVSHAGVAEELAGATAAAQTAPRCHYPAPLSILRCVEEGTNLPMDQGLKLENDLFSELFFDPVAGNMIRSLFIHKGMVEKMPHRPRHVAPRKVARLGIVGAGLMGCGIAYAAARAGMEVVILDQDKERAEKARKHAQAVEDKALSRGKTTPEKTALLLERIHATDQDEDLSGCQMVIEAVFEDRAVKNAILARVEGATDAECVIASNTSTLPIGGLAQPLAKPNRVIGLHFFSPVERMPLVEIIPHEHTDSATLALAHDLVKQLRKVPVVVKDGRGFYTSRTCGAYINEGQSLLLEGVPASLIESSAKAAGMPVGPLALADEVGLDISHLIRDQAAADLGDAFKEASGFSVTRTLVDLGRIGRKASGGFYDYPQDAPKRLWEGLTQSFPPKSNALSSEQIGQRLLWVQALEAARCLDEGILRQPMDGDVAAILGLGFPAYTGGPLSLIDQVGAATFVETCEAWSLSFGSRFGVPDLLRHKAQHLQTFHPTHT